MLTQRNAWICAAIIGVAVAAFTVPRHGVPRVDSGFYPSTVTVPVGQRLEQLFSVRAWGLQTVTVHVSDFVSAEFLDVELEHRERGVPQTTARTTMPLRAAGPLPISFAPAQSGPNAEFALRLQPRSADGAGTVTFVTTEGHEYREGRLWLQGAELALDLVLEADALTGRPWPAFASLLQRRTGVRRLEWLFAVAYVGGVCAIVCVTASPRAT